MTFFWRSRSLSAISAVEFYSWPANSNALALEIDRTGDIITIAGTAPDADTITTLASGTGGTPQTGAIKLIKYQKNIFPAFATHNAYSIAFIEEIARGCKFEFQRIHGMADILHNYFNKNSNLEKTKCRIYAPVGDYEDLLPNLMRRLLENCL